MLAFIQKGILLDLRHNGPSSYPEYGERRE